MIHRSSPVLFQKSTSLWFKIMLALICSFALMLIDSRLSMLKEVRTWAGYGLSPVQKSLAMVPKTISDVGDYGKSQLDLVTENQSLHQQLTEERVRANQFSALSTENQQLKNLLNLKQNSALQTVVAEVFYGNRHPFAQNVLISKGSEDGVEAGQIVLNEVGLVGQVLRVYPRHAEINLVTQKDHNIPVKVDKNSEHSVLVGLGQPNSLELRFMNSNSTVSKGDLISTSGLDEIYPVGIPVAVVESIQNNNDAFLKVLVKPLATGLSERYVMILKNRNFEPDLMQLPNKLPKAAVGKTIKSTPKSALTSASAAVVNAEAPQPTPRIR